MWHLKKDAAIRKLPINIVVSALETYGFALEAHPMGEDTSYTVTHMRSDTIYEAVSEYALREIVIARMRRQIMDTLKPKKRRSGNSV
jgi:hypothetical protein